MQIHKMYNQLQFYDMYGTSMVQFVFLTLVVVSLHSYFKALIHMQDIQANWPNERCKPQNIMIAGLINKPPDQTILEYTEANFTYCVQSVLKTLMGDAVNPLVYISEGIHELFLGIGASINEIRYLFAYLRAQITGVTTEILGRILNIMIPLQQMTIGIRDLMAKTQAIMVSALYTFVGVYYSLVSGLGSVVEFFILIIIILLAIAVPLMMFPFTMEIGAAFLAAAAAISVPFAIISSTLCDVFGMCPTTDSPKLCFDKNTPIELADGTWKPISEVRVGDATRHSGVVTARLVLDASGVDMVQLGEVVVSGVHQVKHLDQWVHSRNHPDSLPISDYKESFIYCLNTTSKQIHVAGWEFMDWDEVREGSLVPIPWWLPPVCQDIHKYTDSGLESTTWIPLQDGSRRELVRIRVGDVLADNVYVMGVVELDGLGLENQYECILGAKESRDWTWVCGGPNLVVSEDKKHWTRVLERKTITKRTKLYHLVTDRGWFKVGNVYIRDYHSTMDVLEGD